MKTKICPDCKLLKRVPEDYHLCKSAKGGITSSCKECRKARAIKWREANLEKCLDIVRRSHAKHSRKTASRRKKLIAENPAIREVAREKSKKSREELTDSYIAGAIFELPVKEVPKELLAAKRVQLQIKRYLEEQT